MVSADGRESQRRPVDRGDVFASDRSPFAVVGLVRICVRPGATEVFELGQHIVETAEPVRQQKQDVNEVGYPPQVRVNGAALNHVVESVATIHLYESRESATRAAGGIDN